MSITDELREWFKDRMFMANGWQEINDIADRIDAEHERQLEVLYRDMSDAEYVKLPKDADGVPIHVGDVMGHRDFPNAKYTVVGIGEDSFFTRDGAGEIHKHIASLYPHYKPTVEDVLREFANEVYADADNEIRDRDFLCAKYAKRLTLAEREDA